MRKTVSGVSWDEEERKDADALAHAGAALDRSEQVKIVKTERRQRAECLVDREGQPVVEDGQDWGSEGKGA